MSSYKSSAVVVLSGGQDSTTCLYWAIKNYDSIATLTFDYGQRHRIELEAAQKIAKMGGVKKYNSAYRYFWCVGRKFSDR